MTSIAVKVLVSLTFAVGLPVAYTEVDEATAAEIVKLLIDAASVVDSEN